MDRRVFLRTATAAAGLTAFPELLGEAASPAFAQPKEKPSGGAADQPPGKPSEVREGDMLYRTLGRTNERVSAIGVGGYHIGNQRDAAESTKIIRTAIDHGVTFMDNCWDYHDGGSEERMGKALADGYRAKVFLMTKIDGRTKEVAARQIDDCLRRLQTDHIDLMQYHEVIRMEDPDRIFAEGGAQEAMLAAKKAGKIRYIGFTGHKDPVVHLRMLDIAEQHGFQFDSVQMPVNLMDAHFRSFGQQVVPRLVKQGVAVLGMKSMGSGLLLESKTVKPQECLRYALSLPTSVVITGIDSSEILDQALNIVKDFKPLSATENKALLERTAQAAATGKYELFKTGNMFDGTARHPEWLG
jgi:predicted aldo/keto reductase-like oxidoreductase